MALKINPITGKFDLLGSTPDWNQNNETSTDYIKNRTHYEAIAEHVEMTDSEYDAKVASGSTFVQVKLNSVTVESNEYLKDGSAGTETGSKQEYNSILSALSAGSDGSVFKNGTSTCKKIAINGIETTLEYLEHKQGSHFYDREGVLGSSFYGADGTADTTLTNIICCYGNGFMLKYYCHVGYNESYLLFLIDTEIYGDGPYKIDFYFECEQTIKKLDEKYLPDFVLANGPKHKRGDVVILQQLPLIIKTKVISWEEFKETYQNYHCSGDRYAQEEFPIGLVADPDKRTFLYLRELSGDIYLSIKDNIESLGNTFYSNGIENTHSIEIAIGANITNHAGSNDIFYNGAGAQLKQFIPSFEESVICKTISPYDRSIFYKFYDRLIELNNLMNDSTHYPIPYGSSTLEQNIFYCFNSTFRKSGNVFHVYNGGSPSNMEKLHEGYMEFFGIYFND